MQQTIVSHNKSLALLLSQAAAGTAMQAAGMQSDNSELIVEVCDLIVKVRQPKDSQVTSNSSNATQVLTPLRYNMCLQSPMSLNETVNSLLKCSCMHLFHPTILDPHQKASTPAATSTAACCEPT